MLKVKKNVKGMKQHILIVFWNAWGNFLTFVFLLLGVWVEMTYYL